MIKFISSVTEILTTKEEPVQRKCYKNKQKPRCSKYSKVSLPKRVNSFFTKGFVDGVVAWRRTVQSARRAGYRPPSSTLRHPDTGRIASDHSTLPIIEDQQIPRSQWSEDTQLNWKFNTMLTYGLLLRNRLIQWFGFKYERIKSVPSSTYQHLIISHRIKVNAATYKSQIIKTNEETNTYQIEHNFIYLARVF